MDKEVIKQVFSEMGKRSAEKKKLDRPNHMSDMANARWKKHRKEKWEKAVKKALPVEAPEFSVKLKD